MVRKIAEVTSVIEYGDNSDAIILVELPCKSVGFAKTSEVI